jgi:hypothetical protein
VVIELRDPSFENDWDALQTAAQSMGIEAQRLAVGIASAEDLEGTLKAAVSRRPQAVIMYVSAGTTIPATTQNAQSAVTSFAIPCLADCIRRRNHQASWRSALHPD